MVSALAAGFVVMIALATTTGAADLKPYDQAAFQAAQQNNQPIVVDVWASWCPTCKAQEPIIKSLAASPDFADLTIFRVDFDTQKDVVRALGARSQSTLIAFEGKTETSRSVGDTNAQKIEALFLSALKN
jgi:thioredoxin-like negative regulator of GroEL